MKNFRKYFLRGSLSHLLPLGAGFVMHSSHTVEAALAMSLAITIVTVFSALIVSALRNVTPEKTHLPIYVLIVTFITTLLCMLMQAYWATAASFLGVHLAALAVSAVPYRDAEESASENGIKKSVVCALVTSAIFAVIMIVCSLIIEPLTFGTITIVGSKVVLDLAFLKIFEEGIVIFMSYVVLAVVIAVMRAVGHKVCNDLEAE